jgi:hypothetical protein
MPLDAQTESSSVCRAQAVVKSCRTGFQILAQSCVLRGCLGPWASGWQGLAGAEPQFADKALGTRVMKRSNAHLYSTYMQSLRKEFKIYLKTKDLGISTKCVLARTSFAHRIVPRAIDDCHTSTSAKKIAMRGQRRRVPPTVPA